MKGSRLLLQAAVKPSRQALGHAPKRHARSAVFSCYRHIDLGAVASLSVLRGPLDPTCLSSRASWSSLGHERPLLLSGSPMGRGARNEPGTNTDGISDHEYQTRVGKACRVIVDSLPDFMQKGVVDLQDIEPDCASSPRSGWSPKSLLPNLSPFLGQSLLKRRSKAKSSNSSGANGGETFDSLYHPSIAFEFRPPLPHIGIGGVESSGNEEIPRKRVGSLSNASQGRGNSGTIPDTNSEHSRGGPTICFNGRTMYIASSHLLRHALSALFHDTSLHLESARFEGRSKAGSSWPGISPYIARSTPSNTEASSDGAWQDKLVIRLRFGGISRVSSQPHTYTVIFKYEFDRETGMIRRHVVDNIQPVPGSKVWAGLSHAWGSLTPAGAAGAASCSSFKTTRLEMQQTSKAASSHVAGQPRHILSPDMTQM